MAKCGLCQTEADLCDSHLIPAAAYKRIRNDQASNPNPIHTTGGVSLYSSVQFSKPYLCRSCEDRFSAGGERHVLSMSSWPNEFPLLERLNRVPPVHALPDGCRAYRLDDADPRSINRYIHFAASVAWRAGSTDWSKARVRLPKCTLGPYEGALRDYLLERKGLDARVFIMMWVIESDLRLTVILPQSERMGSPPYFRHMFCIPGLLFQLFVGADVPASIRAGALNTGGFVLVGGFEQAKLAQHMVGSIRQAKPGGKLERERAQTKSELT